MKRTSAYVSAGIVSGLVLAGAAFAGEVTIYTQPGFNGRALTIQGGSPDLGGFNGEASSVVVKSGRWELCTLADFRGDCLLVGPGEYPRLDARYVNRIASAREVGPVASTVPVEPAPAQRVYVERIYREPFPRYEDLGRFSALEIYTGPGFRGQSMRFDREGVTLDKSITGERIESVIVREGLWRICTGQYGDGYCRTYEPGRYADLGNFSGALVGSVRRIG